MISDLIEIRDTIGIEGLLPQNLPMRTLKEFVERLIELSWDNHEPKKLIGIESMTVHRHTDVLKSLMFLIRCFRQDENFRPNYEEFDQLLKCIRKRYSFELIGRITNQRREPISTVENILESME